MSTFSIFLVLIIIVAFLLIVVIMVQNPKGGGLASSFGGGGSQQLGGVQKTTDFLDRSTWILAGLLLGLILLSNLSIMEGSSRGVPNILGNETKEEIPTRADEAPVVPLQDTKTTVEKTTAEKEKASQERTVEEKAIPNEKNTAKE